MASDIRDELRALGERRKLAAKDESKLASDIERVLRRAYGKVTVSEAANLLGIHRTTVYRVYHPHG
jgi:transcriptional regulator of acetoin/glycerol metabolism